MIDLKITSLTANSPHYRELKSNSQNREKAMNNFIKSFTILLHAIVITALLSNLSMPENNGAAQLQQNVIPYMMQSDAIAPINM
jgi:hypothetical protein